MTDEAGEFSLSAEAEGEICIDVGSIPEVLCVSDVPMGATVTFQDITCNGGDGECSVGTIFLQESGPCTGEPSVSASPDTGEPSVSASPSTGEPSVSETCVTTVN